MSDDGLIFSIREAVKRGDVEVVAEWRAKHREYEKQLEAQLAARTAERNIERERAEKAEAVQRVQEDRAKELLYEEMQETEALRKRFAASEAGAAALRLAVERLYGLIEDVDQGPRKENSSEWRIPWSRAAVEAFSFAHSTLASSSGSGALEAMRLAREALGPPHRLEKGVDGKLYHYDGRELYGAPEDCAHCRALAALSKLLGET